MGQLRACLALGTTTHHRCWYGVPTAREVTGPPMHHGLAKSSGINPLFKVRAVGSIGSYSARGWCCMTTQHNGTQLVSDQAAAAIMGCCCCTVHVLLPSPLPPVLWAAPLICRSCPWWVWRCCCCRQA
jgi:hypothetical protein